eukprot:TRINITY_DN1821_c0_g1_i1.p1 TRINITY_DN1821_c0_g1~~TRINITY_DN1821_c0_g1_i1.p1  ORF type:complete len:287 (-),score=111.40 TRINITY_DN1821_c0_g1_i1:51-911(-)
MKMKNTLLILLISLIEMECRQGFGRWKPVWIEEFSQDDVLVGFPQTEIDSNKWNVDSDCKECLAFDSVHSRLLLLARPLLEREEGMVTLENHTRIKLSTKHSKVLNEKELEELDSEGEGSWMPPLRLEMRARMPKGKFLWTSVRLVPVDPSNEQDSIQILGSNGENSVLIEGSIHTETMETKREIIDMDKEGLKPNEYTLGFHNFVFLWKDGDLSWSVDEFEWHRITLEGEERKRMESQRYFIEISYIVGASESGFYKESKEWVDPVFAIDFVRMYQERGSESFAE